MAQIFILGSIYFWLLICLVFAVIVAATESEPDEFGGFWGGVALIGGGLLLWFGGCRAELISLGNFVAQHPGVIIGGVVLYLVAGTVWSFVKWYLRLTNLRIKFKETGLGYGYADKFNAMKNKNLIISWMIAWPFSLSWTFVDEPLRKSFRRIFAGLQGRYQKIADNILKDIDVKKIN